MIIVECMHCRRTREKEGEARGVSHGICSRCNFIENKALFLMDEEGEKQLLEMIRKDLEQNTWQGEDKIHTQEQITEFDQFVRKNFSKEYTIDHR